MGPNESQSNSRIENPKKRVHLPIPPLLEDTFSDQKENIYEQEQRSSPMDGSIRRDEKSQNIYERQQRSLPMDGSIRRDEESHPSEPGWSDWTRMDHQRLIEPGWIRLNPDGSPNSQKSSWMDSWHNVRFCKPSINYQMLQRELMQFLGNCITLLLIADSVAASFDAKGHSFK